MSKKYNVPVYINATASTYVGNVECDNLDEFNDLADELWKSKGYEAPTPSHDSNFDLGDWDIDEYSDSDLEIYKKNKESATEK